MSDEELFNEYLKGSHAAFAEIYERHSARLFLCAIRITRNAHDAEDIVQDTFIKLAKRKDGPDNLVSWLVTVAKTGGLEVCRNRKPSVPLNHDIAESILDIMVPPISFKDEILRVLEDVFEGSRVVIQLYFFEGLSMKEIGRKLDIPERTAQSRVRAAISDFYRQWERGRNSVLL